MADATASTSHTLSNLTSRSVSTVKNNLPTPEKKTSSRKRKTKCLVHLTSDQNLEETRNKICLFPTRTKRTTSGQSILIGIRAEHRNIVTKNGQKRMASVASALKLLQCQIYEKYVTGCAARSIISGTVRYALVRTVRGSLFLVDATIQNCTTK
jgi:hypothetical protein